MKYETRKDEIIQTSAVLFQKKGYSAVTMRDIAKAMGIKAASLYNHIKSKQEILSEIIISLAEQFTEQMKIIKNSDDNSIDKLKQIVALHVNTTSNNQFGMASLNNDWMHLEAELEYYLKLRKNYENDFRGVIEEGIQGSELINGNPEVMLFSLLSTLRSLYIWLPKKEDLDIEKFTTELSLVLINGINK
ncbi:TetR/AcrR family transcriptional regulator [Flavobacteriaceae bacterium S0825]|uniref:TetR/AcrR family transcriptional regulator n=1 Tax=Gaetbulibacter sp. S0825 TaxID=2720084 RepID=UPI00143212E7|nr:TetR/AcrR family transcriptional regulator [Gaetbulibacter sp. S0825]MCK0108717.1 TetR/AcrR family transcriptional regulator [Flavobacteriaceae bacterium S0825]NIX64353.1 TetR/AcrR family transcriptional regulator [Gaetbulibacter sp. S0825]